MIKKFMIILIMATLLLFSGCSMFSGSGSGFGGGDNGGSSGKSGIELVVAQNNIEPQKGQSFDLFFNIENYQRHEVNDLIIKPTGFERDYVSGMSDTYNVNIPAASERVPGRSNLLMESITLDNFVNQYNWDPIFRYCYSAKTFYREEVCVPNRQNQCDLDVSGVMFQNGPLKVTLDSFKIGDQITITFDINDKLGGNIVNDCFQEAYLNDYGNEFTISEIKLGETSGSCRANSGDKFAINDGSAEIICDFSKTDNDEEFISQIYMELDYKYQQEKQLKIKVEDLESNT